jgi:hypothetical protein
MCVWWWWWGGYQPLPGNSKYTLIIEALLEAVFSLQDKLYKEDNFQLSETVGYTKTQTTR